MENKTAETNIEKKDPFPMILTSLLISSVILAVISYIYGINFETKTYQILKDFFFIPLKAWIFPVIGAAMFSIFFRSPEGRAGKFIILLVDILLLYVLSTLIANIFAFSVFPLFPFAEAVSPLLSEAESITFNKTSPEGIPTVILVMVFGVIASGVFRYIIHKPFALFAKFACGLLVKILDFKPINLFEIFKRLEKEHENALILKDDIDHSLAFINFIDKIILLVLMAILLLAPLAVYSAFLEILNQRGFIFFVDLGKFITFYSAILFSYQFFVMPTIRYIFCFGIKGETYISFLKKAIPVIATAGTTASSVATLATNIKAAQSLNVSEDMKNRGHNRALMPIGATFNMDGTSISLIVYFLLAANLAGIDVGFWWVVLTAVGLSVGTAAVPSASLIMLTSMYNAFSIPAAVTGKLLSIIIAVDPIHDRVRTVVNTWGDLNMVYIVQSKRGIATLVSKLFVKKKKD